MNAKEVIKKFLGLKKDRDMENLGLSFSESLEIIAQFSKGEIKKLIPDAGMFNLVKKAVIFRDKGDWFILGKAKITKRSCQGHFQNNSIVPFGVVGITIGVVGKIFIAFREKDEDTVPMAVGLHDFRDRSGTLISAPCNIFILLSLGAARFRKIRIKGSNENFIIFKESKIYVVSESKSWYVDNKTQKIKSLASSGRIFYTLIKIK